MSGKTIEVVVDPEDIEYDEGSAVARRGSKITDQVATIIENYAIHEPKQGAIHKLFLHFFESPVEILGEDGKVTEFDAVVRIDTPGEADYYRNGGILQYVLRQMVKS